MTIVPVPAHGVADARVHPVKGVPCEPIYI